MNSLILDEYIQKIYIYLLPKNPNDKLYVNMPQIVLEPIQEWINNKNSKNIILSINKTKFSFINSTVINHNFIKNRYGVESRDLLIDYKLMTKGIIRRYF